MARRSVGNRVFQWLNGTKADAFAEQCDTERLARPKE